MDQTPEIIQRVPQGSLLALLLTLCSKPRMVITPARFAEAQPNPHYVEAFATQVRVGTTLLGQDWAQP